MGSSLERSGRDAGFGGGRAAGGDLFRQRRWSSGIVSRESAPHVIEVASSITRAMTMINTMTRASMPVSLCVSITVYLRLIGYS
jgi:hypothetical protein